MEVFKIMAKRLVREHPAMLVGEERDDLERVYAEDTKTHKRYLIKEVGDEENKTLCGETLIAYPNSIEFEIVEE